MTDSFRSIPPSVERLIQRFSSLFTQLSTIFTLFARVLFIIPNWERGSAEKSFDHKFSQKKFQKKRQFKKVDFQLDLINFFVIQRLSRLTKLDLDSIWVKLQIRHFPYFGHKLDFLAFDENWPNLTYIRHCLFCTGQISGQKRLKSSYLEYLICTLYLFVPLYLISKRAF